MKKIYIIELLERDFIKIVGDKKLKGYTYIEHSKKPHKIFIKKMKNKRKIKGTIEHELSHILIFHFNLKKIINKKEFRDVLKDRNFRNYDVKIYNTSLKLREEYLADLVCYIVFGNKFEKKYIKTNYPKNYLIIKNIYKKFKPKIISI